MTVQEEAEIGEAWHDYEQGRYQVLPPGLPRWAFRLSMMGVPPGAIGFVPSGSEFPVYLDTEVRLTRLEATANVHRETIRSLVVAVDNLSRKR